MGSIYHGSTKTENSSGENESFLTNDFAFYYRFGESPLGAMVTVPYVVRHSHELPEGSNVPMTAADLQTYKASGIGDVNAMLRYTDKEYIGESVMLFSVKAGAKLATGASDIKNGEEYLDPDLQPGTGSVDWLFGGSFLISSEDVGYGLNILYGLTGTGARGHRYGSYINGDVNVRYEAFMSAESGSSLFLMLGAGGELRGYETQDAARIGDSGGSIIFLAPGAQYIMSSKILFGVTMQLPVYQYLGGTQFAQSYRLMTSAQYIF
jgi:hypothetical protein